MCTLGQLTISYQYVYLAGPGTMLKSILWYFPMPVTVWPQPQSAVLMIYWLDHELRSPLFCIVSRPLSRSDIQGVPQSRKIR